MKPAAPRVLIADEFLNRGVEVHWLGAEGGMECRQVPEHEIPFDRVRISGVRGKGLAGWLGLPFRLLNAVLAARASMALSRPDCALSFGGYVAGPGGIAAWSRGVPLVVHEQNRVPGLTNRVLAGFAKVVLQAFPGTFPERKAAVTCGNPVRESVAVLADPQLRFFQRRNQPRLLITGGSQGAGSLNQIIPAALAQLPFEARPLVFHQAGAGNMQAVIMAYENAGIEAEVHDFIEDIAAAYEWADLAICRAGALTISELAAAGLGAILVPYPHAVDDHQSLNAAFLEDAGAAQVLPETGLAPDVLAERLRPLLSDRSLMLEMAKNARAVAVTDAAQQVVKACKPWLKT
jgi:UDP-N-acetylglucosamine--N-acetylmuramyl-(pentapeptide) pyrophosphoryl-undecaprenol N-acetylglucosamine transferase